MALEVRMFGHLSVTDKGVPLTQRLSPRARRLLAFLLLHRHVPLPRESVAFILWPDSPEKESLGNLRRALNELRITLPPAETSDWIIATRGELHWNLDAAYWLDAEEFERLIRQATPAALHNAVTLYIGDLLQGLDDEWLLVEREHFRQSQLDTLSHLVAHHRALGEYEVALNLTRQTLALEPLAEAAYRDLMSLHYLVEDRAAALADYERLRTMLRDEFDVEPMPETRALLEAIIRGASLPVVVTPFSVSMPAFLPSQNLPRRIGRETEIAELGRLWESAAVGHGRLAMVRGEAGVGKSHLVLGLADYAAQRGGLALTGHCYQFEHALPYQAIVETLRSAGSLVQHIDLAPSYRAPLAQFMPDVWGAAGQPTAYDVAFKVDDRDQLFEALLQTFLALARRQPLLLVLEDVHWASESTLDWLTYIAPRLSASCLLVMVTYRTGEVGAEHALARLRRRFARGGIVSTLSLQPLSREAVREWIAQMSSLDEELVVPTADTLYTETGGNPFFLQETVRGLIESGHIQISQGHWTGAFVESAAEIHLPLPESLREAINARVGRLTEMSETFIRAASVAGHVFDYRIVQRAGRWDDEAALPALEDLITREFIRESEDGGEFAFVHHLMREAIYAEMTKPHRAYWHRHIAEATLELRPDDLPALAHHYAAAGERDSAIEYARRAGQRAQAVYAFDEAVKHLENALELIQTPEQAEMHMTVLEELADVYDLSGEHSRAVPLYRQALQVWQALAGDKMIAVRLYRKIGETVLNMTRFAEIDQFKPVAQTGLKIALELVAGAPSHPEVVRLFTTLSEIAWKIPATADWEAAERYARAAVEMAEQLGTPLEALDALDALAYVYGARGQLRERMQVSLRRLELVDEPRFGNLRERIKSLNLLGRSLNLVGEYAQAIAYTREAEGLSGQIEWVEEQAFALHLQAQACFSLDRWDDVLKVEAAQQALGQRYGTERLGGVCYTRALCAAIYVLRGETGRATSLRETSYSIMVAISGPPELWDRESLY